MRARTHAVCLVISTQVNNLPSLNTHTYTQAVRYKVVLLCWDTTIKTTSCFFPLCCDNIAYFCQRFAKQRDPPPQYHHHPPNTSHLVLPVLPLLCIERLSYYSKFHLFTTSNSPSVLNLGISLFLSVCYEGNDLKCGGSFSIQTVWDWGKGGRGREPWAPPWQNELRQFSQ